MLTASALNRQSTETDAICLNGISWHFRNCKHLLVDVVVPSVCGTVFGSDGLTAIYRWAENRQDWLEQFLSLRNGIPSRDCIRRLLMVLRPEAFRKCFQD